MDYNIISIENDKIKIKSNEKIFRFSNKYLIVKSVPCILGEQLDLDDMIFDQVFKENKQKLPKKIDE